MAKRRWGYVAAVLIGASAASTAPAQYAGPPVMPPLIVRPPEAMDEPAPRTLSPRERLRQTGIGQFWRGLWSRPTARPTVPRPAVTEIRPTITEATSATSAGCGDLRTWVNQPVATIEPELATTSELATTFELELTRWAEAVGSEGASAPVGKETADAGAKTRQRPPVTYIGRLVVPSQATTAPAIITRRSSN